MLLGASRLSFADVVPRVGLWWPTVADFSIDWQAIRSAEVQDLLVRGQGRGRGQRMRYGDNAVAGKRQALSVAASQSAHRSLCTSRTSHDILHWCPQVAGVPGLWHLTRKDMLPATVKAHALLTGTEVPLWMPETHVVAPLTLGASDLAMAALTQSMVRP